MKNPLVDATWLYEHRHNSNLCILDARNPASEILEKIPNSIHFDLEKTFSDIRSELPHTMVSANKFEIEARKLGINHDSKLVVYDDIGLYFSPRVWWMFKSMGFENVFVLDGGLRAWTDLGHEVVEKYLEPTEIGDFVAENKPGFFCNSADVLAAISNNSTTIVDARNANRYRGLADEPRKGLKRGHISTSVNIPFEECLDGNFLKPKSTLEQTFKDFDRDSKLIFSCGSGVTACIVALAASVAGFENLTVYDGSWSEWGRGDFPIA